MMYRVKILSLKPVILRAQEIPTSKYKPHQGQRERDRRVKQMMRFGGFAV